MPALAVGADSAVCAAWLAARIREVRPAGDGRAVRIVTATNLFGEDLRRRLAREGLGFHLRIGSLGDLAAEVLAADPSAPAVLPPGAALVLVRRIARTRLADGYFGEVVRSGSPGFPRALLASIEDLRASGITGEDLAAFAESIGPPERARSEALAEALSAYEEALEEANLTDRPGAFWEAAEREEAARGENEAALFLAGLNEATAAEEAFLRKIAPRISGAFVLGLWDEQADEAPAWMEAARDFIRLLREKPFEFDLNPPPEPATGGEVLEEFKKSFFLGERPRRDLRGETVALRSASSESQEVVEAFRFAAAGAGAGAAEEETAGGTAPLPFVFLARDGAAYRTVARLAARRLEVPLAMRAAASLAETPEGRAAGALAVLAASETAMRRDLVLALARAAPIPPEFAGSFDDVAELAGRWEILSRKAGVVAGDDWRRAVPAYREALSRAEKRDPDRARPRDVEALELLARYTEALAEALKPLSGRKDFEAFSQAFLAAFDRFVFRVGGREGTWEAVRGVIESFAAFARLPAGASETDAADFAEALSERLAAAPDREAEGIEPFGAAGIFVSDIAGARGVAAETVALAGLLERGFPRRPSADPILPDGARERINAFLRGKRLRPRREARHFERYLFGLAILAARRRIFLSYPRVQPVEGRPRLPSIYFLEAFRAATGKSPRLEDLGSVVFPTQPTKRWEGDAPPLCRAEVDDALLPRLADDETRLSYLEANPFPARAALFAKTQRFGQAYGPYDGITPIEPPEYLSPSLVEAWLRCPYKAFGEWFLGIEEVEPPEEAFEVAPRVFGSLCHAAFEAAGRRLWKEGLFEDPASDASRAAAREAAEEALSTSPERGMLEATGVWDAVRERILFGLDDLLRGGFGLAEGFAPRSEDDFERRLKGTICLDGEAVRFRGTADRVDRSADGRVRVVDYKTGRNVDPIPEPWEKLEGLFSEGENPHSLGVQIPIYLSLLETEGARGAGGILLGFAEAKEVAPLPEEELAARIAPAVRAIRKGVFFPVPGKNCRNCALELVCGRMREVMYERKEPAYRAAWSVEK